MYDEVSVCNHGMPKLMPAAVRGRETVFYIKKLDGEGDPQFQQKTATHPKLSTGLGLGSLC